LKEEKLFDWLDRHGTATIAEIEKFLEDVGEPVISSTLRWRLHNWVAQGLVYRIGRGKYTRMGAKKPFKANPSNHLLENIAWFLKGSFERMPICIWDTNLLSSYTIHQPARSYGIIEVDKYGYESVIERLLADEYLGPFIYDNNQSFPFKGHLGRSGYERRPVIIKRLLQEAPVESYHGLRIPTLEKLIVDLICDEEFFLLYQGRDLSAMLEAFYVRHPVNNDTVLRYATYRSQESKVLHTISKYIDH
jgi:hypothetical protein